MLTELLMRVVAVVFVTATPWLRALATSSLAPPHAATIPERARIKTGSLGDVIAAKVNMV